MRLRVPPGGQEATADPRSRAEHAPRLMFCLPCNPNQTSTQYLRTLVPQTIPLMVFGTRVLKYWVLGPSRNPNQTGESRVPLKGFRVI